MFPAHSACHGIRDLSNPTGTQHVGTVFGGLRMPGHTRFGVMTPRQSRTTSIRHETYAETYATRHSGTQTGQHTFQPEHYACQGIRNPTFRPPDRTACFLSNAQRMPGHTRFDITAPGLGRTTSIRRETHAGTYATRHSGLQTGPYAFQPEHYACRAIRNPTFQQRVSADNPADKPVNTANYRATVVQCASGYVGKVQPSGTDKSVTVTISVPGTRTRRTTTVPPVGRGASAWRTTSSGCRSVTCPSTPSAT